MRPIIDIKRKPWTSQERWWRRVDKLIAHAAPETFVFDASDNRLTITFKPYLPIAPDSPLICPESDEQGSEGTRTPQEPQTGAQGFNVGSYWCNNDTTTLGMDCTRCGATVYEYNDSTPMEDLAVLVDAALAHVCEVSRDVPRTNPQRED